jgi:ribosomal protein S18 acetylase RimI-like enzyme
MPFRLRVATVEDVPTLMPRTRALQDHEGIEISDAALESALRQLLADASLGVVWMIERDGVACGYALVCFSFDLEFGGREGWLTELFIDDEARGSGAGSFALAALETELRARGVRAYHLQVREENPAVRLYERAGFKKVPRMIMSRRL